MKRSLLLVLLSTLPTLVEAYPIDGYSYTGIRRLEYYRLAREGEIPGPRYPKGQYLDLDQVQPRWTQTDGSTLPAQDEEFSRKLTQMLDKGARPNYGIAVLDLSDPTAPRYGAHNGEMQANVGSVGKILVALGIFHQLAQIYPKDIAARERVLKESRVIADAFSQYDHHGIVLFDLEKRRKVSRSMRIGDVGNLWEYLDWMMSASSNSAAAMIQKELIALAHFRTRYPVSEEEKAAFFKTTSPAELGRILHTTQSNAVIAAGLEPEHIRQSSLFTRGGNQRVARGGASWARPDQLVKYLYRLEAGKLIDAWSSRELKRLLYMTQRRIRYASHPALHETAVYFKSGSYFQCHDGPRGCKKYMGDKTNRLGSVAIIESPAENPRLLYLVAVMSNVLKVNSAVAHQTLALRIQRLIESYHPEAPPAKPQPALPAGQPAAPVDGTD
jgi:hypothetical protein